MLDLLDNEKFRIILRDVFERRSLLDHYSLASYYVRVVALICSVQRYYELEPFDKKQYLIDEVNELLESQPDEFIDKDIIDYLYEIREDLIFMHIDLAQLDIKNNQWVNEIVPEIINEIPGMLYPDTMKYYHWIAKNKIDFGDIVELGCWLGQSTNCLTYGILSKNTTIKHSLHVFDTFLWENWMELHFSNTENKINLKSGDSFLDIFNANCKGILNSLSVHNINLFDEKYKWDGNPISLLIYDISQEEELIEKVWAKFFHAFIPNQTVIVFNQYGNARSESIRRFCRKNQYQLRALHKIKGSAKSFLFTNILCS